MEKLPLFEQETGREKTSSTACPSLFGRSIQHHARFKFEKGSIDQRRGGKKTSLTWVVLFAMLLISPSYVGSEGRLGEEVGRGHQMGLGRRWIALTLKLEAASGLHLNSLKGSCILLIQLPSEGRRKQNPILPQKALPLPSSIRKIKMSE